MKVPRGAKRLVGHLSTWRVHSITRWIRTNVVCVFNTVFTAHGDMQVEIWPELPDPLTRLSANNCDALIEHSMILLLSHSRETGFVTKSLDPAVSAATL